MPIRKNLSFPNIYYNLLLIKYFFQIIFIDLEFADRFSSLYQEFDCLKPFPTDRFIIIPQV